MQTFGEWVLARLRDAGAYGGVLDKAEGRAYVEALKRFQLAEGLSATGRADAETIARLRLVRPFKNDRQQAHVIATVPPKPVGPVWYRDAMRLLGLQEIPGPKSNPAIINMAKRLGGWVASFYTNDDIPWCGLFVANSIATTLPEERMPANPLGAQNWQKFGFETTRCLGAIMVFTRKGGGHVGFYVGEDRTHFHILGGNQNNSVSITRIEKSRLVQGGIRWPRTGEPPLGGAIQLSQSGAPLSMSEA